MFKKLVEMGIQKVIQSTPRSQKVGPTIKSVKPNLTKTVKETKTDEYIKRIRELEGAEKKIKTGKKMIKEGQTARKNMIGTKRAFQFKHGRSTHAIKPGEDPNVKYKGNVKEQKAKGGRVGLKFGSRKSNVQKIKETFGPKKQLSPKQMKIAKLAGNPKKIDAADFAKLRRS